MTRPSSRELVEELSKHKAEVSQLRAHLNELDREKELWFSKKEGLSKKIKESIRIIKDNKANRDNLTKEVRELKSKRDSINKDIASKSAELDKLKKERVSISKSSGIKGTPSGIKEQIEKLEFKLETDTASFEKEKELMKRIKELKKMYDGARTLDESDKKLGGAYEDIRKMKKEANEIHRMIQEKAKQSQSLHEEILKMSAEIDKMKGEEQSAFDRFSELKKKFNEANTQFKEKLKLMNSTKEQLDKIDSERREKRKHEQEAFLKSKEEAVNEKIKRGEKLTTEDLLVFQKFEKI